MTTVLAAIDTSAAAAPVLAAAHAIARIFDGHAEAIHVREGATETAQVLADRAGMRLRTFDGAPSETLLSAARDDDVVAVVLGARAIPIGDLSIGHLTEYVVRSLSKPVVVVPPHATRRDRIERVLVPLEGTQASSATMANLIVRMCGHGLDVVLLHVRNERSVPRFTEQVGHETEAWAEEFLMRHGSCPPNQVRLEIRVGSAGGEILRAIEQTGAQLLALSWNQAAETDRAPVVRRCLEQSAIPILLVPQG